MLLAGVVIACGGPPPASAVAEVLPGPAPVETPTWEEPLQAEELPAVFGDLGPALTNEAIPVTGPHNPLGESKVAPLLRRSAWSWYLDPRVIEDSGRTTFAALTNTGDLQVVQIRNSDARLSRFTVARGVRVDDHNSPALLRTASGRYAALWSGHGRTPAFLRVSRTPNDISEWSPRRRLTGSGLERENASYAVLFRAAGRLDQYVAIVRRSSDRLWVLTTSRDLRRWSKAFALVRAIHPIEKREQPYLKFALDGATLHVLASDRQPGAAGHNKIYHFTLGDAVVRRTDGTVVDTLANVQAGNPVDLRQTSLVYDGAGADGQGRAYDIAVVDSEPTVAVTTDGRNTSPRAYKWARFLHGQWRLRTLIRQSAYPEGMTLDSADPRTVYLSHASPGEGTGRILRMRTLDGGLTWAIRGIGDAPGSRTPTTPFGSGGSWSVMWLHGRYARYTDFDTTVTGLTTGPRPVYLAVAWSRAWDRGGRILLRARQGYTSVPAVGVPVHAEITVDGRTRARPVGTTSRSGELRVQLGRLEPGTTVRFVIRVGETWGSAVTASRRAGSSASTPQ